MISDDIPITDHKKPPALSCPDGCVIRLSARFPDDKRSFSLTFENDDTAKEFRKLNPRE